MGIMDRYRCLDRVDYEKMTFSKRRRVIKKLPNNPSTLTNLCCDQLTACGELLAAEAVTTLPAHLAIPLLQSAIGDSRRPLRSATITAILANWPMDTLCFRDILTEENEDLFQEELGFDLIVFGGITSRSHKCRIHCIDLRGFTLNWTFTRLVIQMWPILSLRKSQRNAKRLTDIVIKKARLKHESRLSSEIIPQLIRDLLSHEMITHPRFGISLGRGKKLVVRMDRVEFKHQNTFFMDYLITNCLRDVTPLTIIANNIIINSELSVGDSFVDSLAPFIIFRGHGKETLEGLCWENLEDSVFFATCSEIISFSHLTSLALLNCNICLQEGRTRRRTAARAQVAELLKALPHLRRLDLSHNSFVGCLGELLSNCQRPLDFLSLSDSDLSDCDMDALTESVHASSLRELNLSRICGLFPDDTFAVRTSKLIETLGHFPNLSVLWICHNQILDGHVDSVCQVLKAHLSTLQALYLLENPLSPDSIIKVVRTAIGMTALKYLNLAFSEDLLVLALQVVEQGPHAFQKRVDEILKTANRTDMVVEVFRMSYGLLGAVFGLPV